MEALAARADAEFDLPEDATASVVEGEFLPDNMAALASIVQQTGARIVLSSTWRETWPQRRAVEKQLIAHGISGGVADVTPARPQHEGGRSAEVRSITRIALDCARLRLTARRRPLGGGALDFADRP